MTRFQLTHSYSTVAGTKPKANAVQEDSNAVSITTATPKVVFSLKEPNVMEKLEDGLKNKDLYASFLFIAIQYTIGTSKWKQMIQQVNKTRVTDFKQKNTTNKQSWISNVGQHQTRHLP